MDVLDAVELARDLIRCPSVTPAEGGALGHLQTVLEGLGFVCHRLRFSDADTPDVDNLYARYGSAEPNFCFAGHTDVVPTGPLDGWSVDPFAAEIRDGFLYGRGAVDMKSAIAAFTAAAASAIADGIVRGSISFLITGDEEGPSINGTKKVLGWLGEKGERIDHCVVGEPTNPSRLGEMMKIGRRGSMNSILTVKGKQGHVAYPHLADNAAHLLVRMMHALTREPLDAGNAHFQPSSLQITSIDIGNPTENVIPGSAEARFNIRFNDMHSSDSLGRWIRKTLDDAAGGPGRYDLKIRVSGESFIFPPGDLSALLSAGIEQVTGCKPELSTTGGTSDARFIKDHCPVAEFGLVGETMHKLDERCSLDDIRALTEIYRAVLSRYFAKR
ncbi:MAG: succinyl-diaminopimelate desuccinylase [Alphaproteobacteria bacterium]|nr:succinyl-diaminopimelate desuccinylase [Alphaproteobacteria bacterium]